MNDRTMYTASGPQLADVNREAIRGAILAGADPQAVISPAVVTASDLGHRLFGSEEILDALKETLEMQRGKPMPKSDKYAR